MIFLELNVIAANLIDSHWLQIEFYRQVIRMKNKFMKLLPKF